MPEIAIAYILQGDPTVNGWQLPVGSLGYSFGTVNKLYVKTGGNPTDWTVVDTGIVSGTVSTSAPVSGDGSIGTPITIADGAIALAKNANLAANSVIGNNTGSPAAPTALTQAQLTALLNAASMSLQGAMSAADKGYLDYLSGRWEQVQERFLISKIPQLTGFEYIKIGQQSIAGSAPVNDANLEGGALSAADATVRILGASVIQAPKTGKWGFVFRAAPKVPVATHGSTYGLTNAAVTHLIAVAAVQSIDATHYYLSAGTTGVTTVVVDGNMHDFAITSDGTTITLWIDGVSAATKPTSGLSTDEPMSLYFSSLLAGDAQAAKVLYGYIQP